MSGLYGGTGPPGPGWSKAYREGSPDQVVGLRFESTLREIENSTERKTLKISFVNSVFGAFVGVFFPSFSLGPCPSRVSFWGLGNWKSFRAKEVTWELHSA